MLQIVQRKLSARLRPEQAAKVQSLLQSRFNSLLAGVRLEYLRRLGVDNEPMHAFENPSGSSLLAGEIFMPEAGTVCYIKIPKDGDQLEAGAITNQPGKNFDHFFGEVLEALVNSGAQPGQWQDCSAGPGPEPEDARPVSLEISEKELEAAQEFLKPASNELLHQLSQTESIALQKLNLPKGDSGRLLQHLEDLDLIRKDYAVFSKETGQQILKVASRTSLEESKFFSAEAVDEVISCTSFCQNLIENDQWLQVLVLSQLREMGLAQHGVKILVSQTEGAPTQLFLNINQQRFMLVLTGQKLSLDASYLISAQISACAIKDVALVSTQKIATLMRHHLGSTNPTVQFHFIDGLHELSDKLTGALVDKQRSYLRDLLDPLSELTPVRVQDLVISRFAPQPLAEEMPSVASIAFDDVAEPLSALPELRAPAHHSEPAASPLPPIDHFPPPPPETEGLADSFEFAPAVPDLASELPEPEGAAFDMPAFRPVEVMPTVSHLPVDDFHGAGLSARPSAPARPSWPGELPLE